ncbi:MAG: ABC transporter substrate-binding protein, partial [Roseococcus sp.]
HKGDTLANAVPKVASGGFDVGYGDMNALIEMAGHTPEAAPVAVYVMHNASPYTIAVAADGPVRSPADLAGVELLSHPQDAAMRMFPEFAESAGLDPASARITIAPEHHGELIGGVLAGEAAGLFGFVNTLGAAAREYGIPPEKLRHFEWRHVVPDLYGAAVMVKPALLRERPEVVQGFVAAVNEGLRDTIADPDAAVAAVARRNPALHVPANHARLMGTLALEMAHPEGQRLGIGDVDEARLARAIAVISAAKSLPSRPPASAIFRRDALPADALRIRSLPVWG